MAIAVDDTVARTSASGVSEVTSGAFDVAANTLLVVKGQCLSSVSGRATSMSNNGAALTWTQQVERKPGDTGAHPGYNVIYTAVVTSARTGLTVTFATSSGSTAMSVKPYKVTGYQASDPIGAVGEGSSSGATPTTITPTVYTSTAAGSRALGCATEWLGGGTLTSTDVEDVWGSDAMSVYKSANTPNGGEGVTLNFSRTSGDAQWNWAAVEVLADTGTAPAEPGAGALAATGRGISLGFAILMPDEA